MNLISKNTLIKAINTWGIEAQMMMAIEECAELIKAITKSWRGQGNEIDLVQEIADVQIMVEQLRLIVGQSKVDDVVVEKMARLRQRLDEAQEK